MRQASLTAEVAPLSSNVTALEVSGLMLTSVGGSEAYGHVRSRVFARATAVIANRRINVTASGTFQVR